MSATPSEKVRLCSVEHIPLGLGRAFQIGGRNVGVFRNQAGQVFAVDNACPRRGGPLTDGMIVGERIVCPLHAYRFENGEGETCDDAQSCTVKRFEAGVECGMVTIGLGSVQC